MRTAKDKVYDFWNEAACGENLYLEGITAEDFAAQARERYRLEPYIEDFADFRSSAGKRVLEIGVGLGADHHRFAEAGADLTGIDLTERAISMTGARFRAHGFNSKLLVGDAEALPFKDAQFDVVYSWGVIHHSPNTEHAAQEILRVLRPGGRFAVMIYHRRSLVGYMLWLRYALLRGRPLTSLDEIYDQYLESPGTKAYSKAGAADLFSGAHDVETRVVLTHGDLLESNAGQRHGGLLLRIARLLWPRSVIRRYFAAHGLFLLVSGSKAR